MKIPAWLEPHSRFLWGLMAVLAASLIILAHNVFQVYLYMKPCEQCVYIRAAFLGIALAGLIALPYPRSLILRLVGYVLAVASSIYGVMCSLKLARIHHAVHSTDMDALFGLQGCSLDPKYPFGIPLHKWAPDWFLPTGDCGYENSEVPANVALDPLQRYLIEMYDNAGGWYLWPSEHFLSMAQCCLIAFGTALVILALMMVRDAMNWRQQ